MKTAKFKCPKFIKHRETKQLMSMIVDQLEEKNKISPMDWPQLHRMATSYDTYLDATEWLAENGYTAVNKKGEDVKHPYVNIQRESWDQFLRLAKEYGLTIKSRAQIQAHKPADADKEISPLDEFLYGQNDQ